MLVGVSSWGAPKLAEPSAEDQAVKLYQRSAELYRQGSFEEAAALLREAYRRKPDPVLQYNLARACEEMGDLECAIAAYEKYLLSANPTDRRAIEQRVARCRTSLAARARAATPAPAPLPQPSPQPPAQQSPRKASVVPPILTGVGIASVGVGVALALTAKSRHKEAESEQVQRTAAARQDRAESMMTAANVTLIAGGVTALAAAVFWVLDATSARPAAASTSSASASSDSVALWIGLDSVQLALHF